MMIKAKESGQLSIGKTEKQSIRRKLSVISKLGKEYGAATKSSRKLTSLSKIIM